MLEERWPALEHSYLMRVQQPRLGALVRAILRHLPELPRLRISSIDPVEIDGELLRALAEEERLMPHLHLSLQAGDDLILKRMKRRHSRPGIVFGADLIAGFPTETEAQFRNSLALVDDCGLTFLHVFPFSIREGTPAAKMPQLGRGIAKERAHRLREKGETALRRHLANEVGSLRKVLVERDGGRTEYYAEVRLKRPSAPGTIRDVFIAGHDGRRLLAA